MAEQIDRREDWNANLHFSMLTLSPEIYKRIEELLNKDKNLRAALISAVKNTSFDPPKDKFRIPQAVLSHIKGNWAFERIAEIVNDDLQDRRISFWITLLCDMGKIEEQGGEVEDTIRKFRHETQQALLYESLSPAERKLIDRLNYVRSKVLYDHVAGRWNGDAQHLERVINAIEYVVSTAAGGREHLLQAIEHLDTAGGARDTKQI